MSADTISVFIADDHPAFRHGLQGMLSAVEGIDVLGEAPDGEETLRAVDELRPDVVLMDLHMPRLNGIDATRRLVDLYPEIAVVVLTMLDNDDSVFAAMRAGARGYLLKGADQDDVVRAIRSAAGGDVIFGPVIAERVLDYFSEEREAQQTAFPQLTVREREVLDEMALGRSNDDIAKALEVSPKTVRNHVSNIFAKLHVATRAEAIVAAREGGLGRESLESS